MKIIVRKPFPERISLKVNVIAQLEFEPAYFEVSVQHLNHYATGFPTPQEH